MFDNVWGFLLMSLNAIIIKLFQQDIYILLSYTVTRLFVHLHLKGIQNKINELFMKWSKKNKKTARQQTQIFLSGRPKFRICHQHYSSTFFILEWAVMINMGEFSEQKCQEELFHHPCVSPFVTKALFQRSCQ